MAEVGNVPHFNDQIFELGVSNNKKIVIEFKFMIWLIINQIKLVA